MDNNDKPDWRCQGCGKSGVATDLNDIDHERVMAGDIMPMGACPGCDKHVFPLKRFSCSYAYDIPHYADFVVEADTKEQALAMAQKALDDGELSSVMGNACFENECDHRVFISGEEKDPSVDPSLEELIAETILEKR